MSSGSAVTGEFVPGRKLLVHAAENGHSFEFECDGATPVEAIQRSIESLCGVHIADQLLLCGNTSLHAQQPLGHYKLPQDDREVFLYNKSRLHAESPRPPIETIDVPGAVVPAPPSPSRNPHPFDDASDPALKALASYERQFRHHFQVANAIYGCTQTKFEVCKRLLREQEVQERALETARGNLDHAYLRLRQRFEEFIKRYSQQHRFHSDLLANYERDLERLRSIKLHPALQSDNRKCLLDFTKEDGLRKYADICFTSHRKFECKVSQLKLDFRELEKRVENLLLGMHSAGSKDLELAIKDHQKILNDQKSIMQSLSKDVNTVKKHVDDYLSCQLSSSLRPHDAVSALGPMYDAHEKNLPEAQKCDHAITKLLDRCKGKKNDMNILVHVSMQNIKSVQFGIKDIINELHAFQEVMGHQEREFGSLKIINGISHAYRACLAEVVRRKSSLKLHMGLAGQLAERLATEREAEIRKREGFFKAWSKYIPHDILESMGLFDSPSQCDVNIAPFDTNLLEIDVADVDRFAPQFFVGFLSKFERNESQKSCSPKSSDRSSLTKAEENSLDTFEKFGSENLLEGCETVDIAGTSKMEVENARLKAELASAIALICTYNVEGYDLLDEGKLDNILKTTKEMTVEALHLKDEYGKHLHSMLDMKQEQCLSYEKRIQELELRLSDQYMQGQKLSSSKDACESILSAVRTDDFKSGVLGDGEAHIPYITTMSTMDEASCSSASVDPKLDHISGETIKPGGGDENMMDLSGTLIMHDPARNSMDTSMLEPPREEHQVTGIDEQVGDIEKDRIGGIDREGKTITPQLELTMRCSSDVSAGDPLNLLPCGTAAELPLESNTRDKHISDLQNALTDNSKHCDEVENKLKSTMEEVNSLRRELEISRNLLDESQMNCAHLENCLHEAREEAHTNLCAADRRAKEYSALRVSAVRMQSLFERLRSCVTASVGVAGFSDSLRSLALSLGSSVNEDEDGGTVEFRACIKVLAEKVGFLYRHRSELLERYSRAEATNGHLRKELEEKNELIASLYKKHQIGKQANKEKISFGRFEVHEIAAFVLNPSGCYEAINRNCSNYYLSAESVALFTEHCPSRPTYIIGQIVHIERQKVRPPGSTRDKHGDQSDPHLSSDSSDRPSPGSGTALNQYGLPVGCEYFLVTVAMLPDTIHPTPS